MENGRSKRRRWSFKFLVSVFASLLTTAVLLCPSKASGAWAKTNDKYGSGTGDPVSTPAFTSALTNPSIIIVGVYRSSTTIATPTDTAGNAYVDCGAGLVLWNVSAYSVRLFYSLNTHTTASNVVSVANAGGKSVIVVALEWTGGATSSPIDGTPVGNPNANTGTGGGQNMTAGPTTPSVNGDLIVGFSRALTGTVTVGTGFTGSASSYMWEYLIQATAAPISATWSNNTNNAKYGAIVAAFKLATVPSTGRKAFIINIGMLLPFPVLPAWDGTHGNPLWGVIAPLNLPMAQTREVEWLSR
jgi:hypothetical protein